MAGYSYRNAAIGSRRAGRRDQPQQQWETREDGWTDGADAGQQAGQQAFDEVMNLNFRSAWAITQAVAPHMIRQGRGIVVNVSSIAARNGGGLGASAYAAAKAAVISVTKSLAEELAPKGIRVDAVSPGAVGAAPFRCCIRSR